MSKVTAFLTETAEHSQWSTTDPEIHPLVPRAKFALMYQLKACDGEVHDCIAFAFLCSRSSSSQPQHGDSVNHCVSIPQFTEREPLHLTEGDCRAIPAASKTL